MDTARRHGLATSEWTNDWYPRHAETADACCIHTIRSKQSNQLDPAQPVPRSRKVIKGGSHLCADDYCLRYRPAPDAQMWTPARVTSGSDALLESRDHETFGKTWRGAREQVAPGAGSPRAPRGVNHDESCQKQRLPVLEALPVEPPRPVDMLAGVTSPRRDPRGDGIHEDAGMPVITGLYTILIPIAVFAVLGSSRHLVVGADSATAAILAAGLAGAAPIASPQYVALAGALAIVTGGVLILARLLRLGFIADFLSRSVLIGFLTGVGTQVAMGQVAGMLGSAGTGARSQFTTLGNVATRA
jgi:hypothetical protein